MCLRNEYILQCLLHGSKLLPWDLHVCNRPCFLQLHQIPEKFNEKYSEVDKIFNYMIILKISDIVNSNLYTTYQW